MSTPATQPSPDERIHLLEVAVRALQLRLDGLEQTVSGLEGDLRRINEAEDVDEPH